ncbi:MAG: S-formylglutathione hydrolase [Pseudomonadota bacterium]
MQTLSESVCFGGLQGVYSHASDVTGTTMTFGLFRPAEAQDQRVPVLWFLAGLTCTHENAMVKAGAQAWASEHGIALVFPDTSPRGEGVPDHEDFYLGQGAGFYVNAVQDPWAKHFRMWDYLDHELPQLIFSNFNLDPEREAITGHSMGGHGALTLAMRRPERFKSVSAFAPIANPVASDWGRKQFAAYLGDDETVWADHDASCLMTAHGLPAPLLIDQGADDQFWDLLRPEALATAMASRRQPGAFRIQPGYDHSYFFVASFMEDHIDFHAENLLSDDAR